MNKRERMLAFLAGNPQPETVPAAFFLHFDPAYHQGEAAVQKHLDFFRATDMDFVKIQYEHTFPRLPDLRRPADWASIPVYDEAFFAAPLAVVEGVVKAAKAEALVVVTLYSAFMCAGHASGGLIADHLREDPEQVKTGMERVTAGLLTFVRGCIDRGVDGFYLSTQGGEAGAFDDSPIFDDYIRPYDLALMEEADDRCIFNILHVCDYHGPYNSLDRFVDYPGHVVNCSLQVGDTLLRPSDAASLFKRPYMGGMDRHGAVARGDRAGIEAEVMQLLSGRPARYILGADCTIPSSTHWDDVRFAVDLAHRLG